MPRAGLPAAAAEPLLEPASAQTIDPRDERIMRLESELVDLRARVAAAQVQRAAVTPPSPRVDPAELVTLRATLRERNDDCRELRRQLAESQRRNEQVAKAPARGRSPAAEGRADAPARKALSPRLDRAVLDALAVVPTHVAAQAVRTLGALASGDEAAWRSVKQAKDLDATIYMARIGIHHRLLMRVDSTELVAVELVQRERLSLTLKRYRR